MGVNVVHIFNSRNTHLNPGIIEGIEKHKRKDDKHRFYISFINPRKLKDEKQIYGILGEGKLDIYSIYSIFAYMKAILSNNDVFVLNGLLSSFSKLLMLFFFIRLFFFNLF